MPRFSPLLVLAMLLVPVAGRAAAEPPLTSLAEVASGQLLMATDTPGQYRPAPTQSTRAEIAVTGPIARTVLSQTFRNPSSEWAEALYAFPLPEDAAVDHLRMRIGERIIVGEIQERVQARQTYEKARDAGQKAALVEQQRPNLFTTAVANIPPDGEIRIEIEYQQRLRWHDGEFSLRLPLAITPRFSPDPAAMRQSLDLADGWSQLPGELPNRADLTPGAAHNPVELALTLRAGFAVDQVYSPSHAILQRQHDGAIEVELAEGQVRSDRDFLLSWRPRPGQAPQAAFFTEHTAKGDFGLLMLTPPQGDQRGQLTRARELILVIDTSGSMGGEPIRSARAALLRALASLKPGDRFNVIQFNSATAALFAAPVPADAAHLRQARQYVQALSAGGGTMMQPALERALRKRGADEAAFLRQIVFVTDGAVANEAALFELIHRRLGEDRLFTVGIGSAPNTHFMTEAARAGRGSFTYIARGADVEPRMERLFDMLDHPVLTGLQLELLVAAEVLPDPIPDLYDGEPVELVMRLDVLPDAARLSGLLGQQPWSADLTLGGAGTQSGIGVLWAREKIAHWQRQGRRGVEAETIRQHILELALDHHLVSPHTSLVAVDRTPSRPAQAGLDSHALQRELPAGMAVPAVPLATGATPSLLQLLAALLLLLAAGLINAQRGIAPRHANNMHRRSAQRARSAPNRARLCAPAEAPAGARDPERGQ